MKELSKEFKKHGYLYKLVERTDKKAIYSQYYNNIPIAYEVIKIRIRPAKYNQFLKRQMEEREVYPCDEDWGTLARTVKTWEKALERFDKILNV